MRLPRHIVILCPWRLQMSWHIDDMLWHLQHIGQNVARRHPFMSLSLPPKTFLEKTHATKCSCIRQRWGPASFKKMKIIESFHQCKCFILGGRTLLHLIGVDAPSPFSSAWSWFFGIFEGGSVTFYYIGFITPVSMLDSEFWMIVLYWYSVALSDRLSFFPPSQSLRALYVG